jgi:hypothetical protein
MESRSEVYVDGAVVEYTYCLSSYYAPLGAIEVT